MNVWRLVMREIAHRKLNFALGVLSVAVAVACFVGSLTLLEAHEVRTHEILEARTAEVQQAVEAKEAEVKEAGAALENAMRKIQLTLGFNLWILPEGEDLEKFNLDGVLTKTMPEAYVEKLANSRVVTVNHLLPVVTHRLDWRGPREEQTIIMIGTRGEVPLMHKALKKQLQEIVEPGKIVLGHHVQSKQDLKVGDKVNVMGRDFEVSAVQKKDGSINDSTVWINLAEAQEMLGLQNLIHGIQAIECNCATKDRIGQIREELAALLPGTDVEELGAKALTRAETRTKAKQAADEALANQIKSGQALLDQTAAHREELRVQREALASILVPLVIVASALLMGLLAFGNVKQRSGEIGILRAIGLRSSQLLSVFLTKAILIGLLGAAVGYLAGFSIGIVCSEMPLTEQTITMLYAPGMLVLALVMAPVLSAVASWIPAMLAAGQDPAVVLQGDQ